MFVLLLAAIILFIIAYRFYGAFLDRRFTIDSARETPAHTRYDGVDYLPTRTPVLMGHHFSSIAGAGPIVGPIIAVAFFGWLPAVIWIILGSIFIGGVHDYSALVVSIRQRARSIAQVAKRMMSPLAHKLYLAFIWLAMIYVLVAFVDLTAGSFTADGGVASSSLMYIGLAVFMGLAVYRLNMSLVKASLIFVPLVFLAIFLGQQVPFGELPPLAHLRTQRTPLPRKPSHQLHHLPAQLPLPDLRLLHVLCPERQRGLHRLSQRPRKHQRIELPIFHRFLHIDRSYRLASN